MEPRNLLQTHVYACAMAGAAFKAGKDSAERDTSRTKVPQAQALGLLRSQKPLELLVHPERR